MTDASPPTADGELLSAYLAGELDAADAELLEHRLDAEPALAAQLDVLASALVELHDADEAEVPDGFGQRLATRLEQERSGAKPVASLDRARERRADAAKPKWWVAVGTVAAVAAAGALMASGVLRGLGAGGASEDSAEITAAEGDDAGRDGASESAADVPAQAPVPESQSGRASAAPARPTEPIIREEAAVRLRREGALGRRYVNDPQVIGMLGTPLDEAADLAASFTQTIQNAPPFDDGTAPAACLATATGGAEQPLVPVLVEALQYQATPAVAYVLVTAAPDAEELDRVEVWVLERQGCATLVFVQR